MSFDSSRDRMPTFDPGPITYVNAYEVERNYGGPEEGGWWYDSGRPLASIPCTTDEEIEIAEAQLKRILGPQYAQRRTRYSVIGEENLMVVQQDHMAREWPDERPHYE